MQNSGLGNAINPIVSLADELVYKIPMLLLVGWRGQPHVKDEPQHKKQGMITRELLESVGIKYKLIGKRTSMEDFKEYIDYAYEYMNENKKIYALIIEKDTFSESKIYIDNKIENYSDDFEMSREEAIEVIAKNVEKDSAIISTTGMASRELFEIRERLGQGHNKDFLTVGSMGHASQIALGIALNSQKNIYCIDGDGALIMHLGGLAIIGDLKPKNLKHIVINNGAHDSVGGQKTVGFNIDIVKIAEACAYNESYICYTKKELLKCFESIKNVDGPVLIEVRVKKGARKDLGRPSLSPEENKRGFMELFN